jgi:hypothetical protein
MLESSLDITKCASPITIPIARVHMPPAPGRPYAHMSIDELEAKAKLASSDDGVRQLLIRELVQRTTSRAHALLQRVQSMKVGGGGNAPVANGGSKSSPPATIPRPAGVELNTAGKRAIPKPAPDSKTASSTTTTEVVDLRAQYDQLRALVGQDAEDLARWGLVPGAPKDIMLLVFDAWEKRVGPFPDLYGRSTPALNQIRSRFKA